MLNDQGRAQKKQAEARYLNLRSMLGNKSWGACQFIICGARDTGKSYAVMDHICKVHKQIGKALKAYWCRISDTSCQKLLANNGEKLIDPDLRRKYDYTVTTKNTSSYVNAEKFCEVIALSGFAKSKGVAFFDKDFTGRTIIVLDEFQLEEGEKRTSFDILYNWIGTLENLIRSKTSNLEIFYLANSVQSATTILKAFNFIPAKFGRFYLRSKRCVIDNLEPTAEYLKEISKSIPGLLGGATMANYTNMMSEPTNRIKKRRCIKPTEIIHFSKNAGDWYTVWDAYYIKKYNGENLDETKHIYMRPYLGGFFSKEKRQSVIEKNDVQYYEFQTLIDLAFFEDNLKVIRKL